MNRFIRPTPAVAVGAQALLRQGRVVSSGRLGAPTEDAGDADAGRNWRASWGLLGPGD
jgi:hypothetical protein